MIACATYARTKLTSKRLIHFSLSLWLASERNVPVLICFPLELCLSQTLDSHARQQHKAGPFELDRCRLCGYVSHPRSITLAIYANQNTQLNQSAKCFRRQQFDTSCFWCHSYRTLCTRAKLQKY